MTTKTLYELRGENIIDSRDIIERIDELESMDVLDEIETEELAVLRAFADEAASYFEDWTYGEGLIEDSFFVSYAQELAEDIGAIAHDAPWPTTHIDWDAAADALKMDYTSIELDGFTYWGR